MVSMITIYRSCNYSASSFVDAGAEGDGVVCLSYGEGGGEEVVTAGGEEGEGGEGIYYLVYLHWFEGVVFVGGYSQAPGA